MKGEISVDFCRSNRFLHSHYNSFSFVYDFHLSIVCSKILLSLSIYTFLEARFQFLREKDTRNNTREKLLHETDTREDDD